MTKFRTGRPATGKYFFDRSKLKKKLTMLFEDQVDVMIKAPRRYGKTSLAKEILGSKTHIYVDFMEKPQLSDIVEILLDRTYQAFGLNDFIKKVKKHLSSLFSDATVKADIGIAQLSLGVELITKKEKDPCSDFLQALDIIDKLGEKHGKAVTIVFDEFQEIINFECGKEILAMLRSTLQHQDHIHAVFLGSVESIMTEIFEDKNSPFYNFCNPFTLEPFDIDELYLELAKVFRSSKMIFEPDGLLKSFLRKLEGHPANTMLAVRELYSIAKEKEAPLITQEDIDEAYENAYYTRYDATIQIIIRAKKKKYYYDVLYATARGEDPGLNPATLYNVRSGLVDMGIMIKRGKDNYLIADNFLREYLRS